MHELILIKFDNIHENTKIWLRTIVKSEKPHYPKRMHLQETPMDVKDYKWYWAPNI